jgi:hypothetical protein
MKEFLLEDKTLNIMQLTGKPKTEKCFIVVNAELARIPDEFGGMRSPFQKQGKTRKEI